jgi:Flp pilus assembly protein CpaB
MSRGEPLTTARLLDTSITRSLRTGQVAVTVHVESTGAAGLIQPGSRIDLYARPSPTVLVDGAAAEPSAEASLVATSVVVLAAYPDDDRTSSDTSTVVLAATRAVASQVANRPSGAFLATLLPPS